MVLAMIADRDAQIAAVGKRHAHQRRIVHRVAIVAEGYHPGSSEFLHVSQFTPRSSPGNATDNFNVDWRRVPLGGDEIHHRRIVNRRIGVGHGTYRREAAPGRGERSGGYGFFVLESRLSQVSMDVYETGTNYQARGIYYPSATVSNDIPEPGGDRGDFPFANENIRYFIPPDRWVNYSAAGDEDRWRSVLD
jgi:hypothetical protein